MPLALVSSDPTDLATGVSVEQVITLTFRHDGDSSALPRRH